MAFTFDGVRRVFGIAVLASSAAAVTLADQVTPEVLQQYQKIYVRERAKELDKLVAQMTQSSGVHLADRSFTTFAVPSPSGERSLLALSRVSPEPMDRWLLMVVEPAKLHIGMVFDFLEAFDLQRVTWLDEHRILVLARTHNLSGPPGKLFLVNVGTGRADLLDDFVWRFELAPSNDDIAYEQSEDPREPYGIRSLYHLQLSTRDRRRVEQVRHPSTQFGEIGPFETEGTFLQYEVNTYGADSFEPKRTRYWFDVMAGRSFEASGEGLPSALGAAAPTTSTTN